MKHFLVSEELMKAAIQSLGTQPHPQVRTLINVLELCTSVDVTQKQPESEVEKKSDIEQG